MSTEKKKLTAWEFFQSRVQTAKENNLLHKDSLQTIESREIDFVETLMQDYAGATEHGFELGGHPVEIEHIRVVDNRTREEFSWDENSAKWRGVTKEPYAMFSKENLQEEGAYMKLEFDLPKAEAKSSSLKSEELAWSSFTAAWAKWGALWSAYDTGVIRTRPEDISQFMQRMQQDFNISLK